MVNGALGFECPLASFGRQRTRAGPACRNMPERPRETPAKGERSLSLPEQRLGARLEAAGGRLVILRAGDFRFQNRYALVEFRDRKRVERLARQRGKHVVAAAGKVVIFHGAFFLSQSLLLSRYYKARDC